jgi:hypothetical protein
MYLLQNHEWHCLEYSDDISSIRTEYCRDYEAYYYKWIYLRVVFKPSYNTCYDPEMPVINR